MWHVKIDLAYRVAYLLDERGELQAAQSGVTRLTVDDVLTSWGYEYTSNTQWECTDILNAIDAVQRAVQPLGV